MRRPLSGGRFAVTVVWRLAAFVALSLAGPWIATTIQDDHAVRRRRRRLRRDLGRDRHAAPAADPLAPGAGAAPPVLAADEGGRDVGHRRAASCRSLLLLDWRTLTAFGLNYVPVTSEHGAAQFGLSVLHGAGAAHRPPPRRGARFRGARATRSGAAAGSSARSAGWRRWSPSSPARCPPSSTCSTCRPRHGGLGVAALRPGDQGRPASRPSPPRRHRRDCSG